MLQLPYINTRLHLQPMMDLYDAFAALYNADINEKRANDPANQKNYQTLKATHRATFKDLILETGKRMLQNINRYQAINTEQGNEGTFSLLRSNTERICGADYYSCSTSRLQLKKHSGKEQSTITRNINRLMDAGIISKKINHGHYMYFELQIRAEFLIVSDKANPMYNPMPNVQETAQQRAFSLYSQIAFCKGKEKEQEQLINKLYSETSEILNSTGSENSVSTAGTLTGTTDRPKAVPQPTEGKRAENNHRGRAFATTEMEARGEKVDQINLIRKTDLTKWHTFHRLAHSAYFVDYLIDTIYTRRNVEIYPDARRNLIEYAERFYFPNPAEAETSIYKPCVTMEDYTTRLNGLIWCINAANRYSLAHNTFFVMPNRYIDIENTGGLTGTLQWYKTAKQNANNKARHLKNIADIAKLHAKIRELAEGKTTLAEAENYVENHLQKYKYVFRHSLVTVINQMEKG